MSCFRCCSFICWDDHIGQCLQARTPLVWPPGSCLEWRMRTPSICWGFPCGSAGKESAYNVGDLGSIHGLGRSPAEGKGYPLQYSDLENSMDSTVHSVTKSRTQLSNFHFHFLSQSTEERKNIFQCTHAMKNERQLQRTR